MNLKPYPKYKATINPVKTYNDFRRSHGQD